MMAGNPNWWSSIDNMRPSSHHQQPSSFLSSPPSLISPQYAPAAGSSSLPFNMYTLAHNHHSPQSWSQLLLGGLAGGDEDRLGLSHYQSKKLEIWEDQNLNLSPRVPVGDVKQEDSQVSHHLRSHGEEEYQASRPAWSPVMSVLSPKSCVTSSSSILDFSKNKRAEGRNQHPDHSSECNSTAAGGISKKARVQSSSTQPPLKVRKEKLGDRITALHQLVSPFGKTDTASVLLEAIGYIRFLQGQIEALSSPYLGNARSQQSLDARKVGLIGTTFMGPISLYADSIFGRRRDKAQGERSCIFPEDPGQLLNDACLKRRGTPNQDTQEVPKDLRSRGLCLVPVSCTHQVGSDNGADYWAPALNGGF